ncbi:hypothetical protein GLAREA_10918 [Glarea lozoyensis ATCC 20868]|uniref:Uncharacterized protein n=1 Tax=Glarea lozoyensis (strain ATCC 20868 / MF5171) TaxID=1116229 RepID=S3DTF2_GLAL2|nr:uncharacterized protein GLAREA_10918 [Glarea lozoyensis ATCC 20868]EPE35221.1 hypothetical protein GLAREA_10918 [Glarea lozoyensis ATCC 20868]
MDDDQVSAGDTLADDIFTSNGVLESVQGSYNGSEGKQPQYTKRILWAVPVSFT